MPPCLRAPVRCFSFVFPRASVPLCEVFLVPLCLCERSSSLFLRVPRAKSSWFLCAPVPPCEAFFSLLSSVELRALLRGPPWFLLPPCPLCPREMLFFCLSPCLCAKFFEFVPVREFQVLQCLITQWLSTFSKAQIGSWVILPSSLASFSLPITTFTSITFQKLPSQFSLVPSEGMRRRCSP